MTAQLTIRCSSFTSYAVALDAGGAERGRLPHRPPAPQSEPLQRATLHICRHPGSPLSVSDIARRAAMSERTLRRHFLAELGMTPHAYLHSARMLAALDQLADPEVPITTVAPEVGFQTPSAFSHAFLDFTGESPRDYRRRVTTYDRADDAAGDSATTLPAIRSCAFRAVDDGANQVVPDTSPRVSA